MARCVGRGEWAPLAETDIAELGSRMEPVDLENGAPPFAQGDVSRAVGSCEKDASNSLIAKGLDA